MLNSLQARISLLNLSLSRNVKGFTLIEIVIVVAIAALILAAVVLFIPQAQKAERDVHRKNDAAKILAKFRECEGVNKGLAGNCTPAVMSASYMAGISPPGGGTYTLSATNPTCTTTANTNVGLVLSNSNANAAVTVCLETTGTAYTVSN